MPQKQNDPSLYSTLLGNPLQDRNPLQAIAGDLGRMISVLANLGKTRKMAQTRIEQLQRQVETVEGQIASVNPKTVGNRIDKLR